jgi:hypothetical protein
MLADRRLTGIEGVKGDSVARPLKEISFAGLVDGDPAQLAGGAAEGSLTHSEGKRERNYARFMEANVRSIRLSKQ